MTTHSTTKPLSPTWIFDSIEARATLNDGSEVHIREVVAEDEAAIRSLYASLTPESLYLRFFTQSPSSVEAEVTRLLRIAPGSHEALLAVQDDAVVAVGCYEILSDPTKAEVAMVMGEGHHRLGLGSALVARLATVARARGIQRFVVETLYRGDFMVDVVHHLGLPIHTVGADLGCLEYELEL